jgi:hypothetical protein
MLAERIVFDRTLSLDNEVDDRDDWTWANDIIIQTVKDVFEISAPLRRPQDTGGVFLMTWNVMDNWEEGTYPEPFQMLEVDHRVEFTVGTLGPNDAECPTIVREKATRVQVDYLNSERTHHSSWQSRDLAAKQYGGAFMAHDWVLSFSGCSEHMDEAICLVVAEVIGLFSKIDAEYIAAISGNEIYPKLKHLVYEKLA